MPPSSALRNNSIFVNKDNNNIFVNKDNSVFANKDSSAMTVDTTMSTELATVNGASGQLEVNFEKNVTVLYDSISNSNWDVALRTLQHNPEEARTWVVRYHENENNGIMWRFLPLHSACARQPPIAVVSGLLRAFPDAANCCDDQGMYPLHYACGNHASAEVIRELVDANSTAARMGDPNGMIPMHYMSQWGPSSLGAIEALIVASPGVKDLQDSQGFTPLEYAIDGDYPERDQMVAALESDGQTVGVEDDGASQTNNSVYDNQQQEQEQEQEQQELEASPDMRQQQVKKPVSYPPVTHQKYSQSSRALGTDSNISPSRGTPNNLISQSSRSQSSRAMGSRTTSSPRGTPVQPLWASQQQEMSGVTQTPSPSSNWNQQQPDRITARANSMGSQQQYKQHQQQSKRSATPDHQRNLKLITSTPPPPAWLTNNNQQERTLPRRKSFTPSLGSNTPSQSQWNDRPIVGPSESISDMLPPRYDHNSSNNTVTTNTTNTTTPNNSMIKSLVKLNAEIVKLQAEAAFNEAEMDERLLNQREAIQAQIDFVNANIAKSENEISSVKADLTAKDEYTMYVEKSTQSIERDTKETIEDNSRLERELYGITAEYDTYKKSTEALQAEAGELAKSMRVMRQEQEHILANLSLVEEDIGNASRARKKKLQAMFDEEMKYSMENVEYNRVDSGMHGSNGLSVRQKLEEQKTLMERCGGILAACE